MENNDESGINCLSGFTFQIKVFFYYLSSLNEYNQIEFEALDDISIASYKPEDLDNISKEFSIQCIQKDIHEVVQVKRTELDKSKMKKILINWLILEHSDYNIESFTLFCTNGVIFDFKKDINITELYNEILQTQKKSSASISKWFNNERLHSSLGYIPPIEYRESVYQKVV